MLSQEQRCFAAFTLRTLTHKKALVTQAYLQCIPLCRPEDLPTQQAESQRKYKRRMKDAVNHSAAGRFTVHSHRAAGDLIENFEKPI